MLSVGVPVSEQFDTEFSTLLRSSGAALNTLWDFQMRLAESRQSPLTNLDELHWENKAEQWRKRALTSSNINFNRHHTYVHNSSFSYGFY